MPTEQRRKTPPKEYAGKEPLPFEGSKAQQFILEEEKQRRLKELKNILAHHGVWYDSRARNLNSFDVSRLNQALKTKLEQVTNGEGRLFARLAHSTLAQDVAELIGSQISVGYEPLTKDQQAYLVAAIHRQFKQMKVENISLYEAYAEGNDQVTLSDIFSPEAWQDMVTYLEELDRNALVPAESMVESPKEVTNKLSYWTQVLKVLLLRRRKKAAVTLSTKVNMYSSRFKDLERVSGALINTQDMISGATEVHPAIEATYNAFESAINEYFALEADAENYEELVEFDEVTFWQQTLKNPEAIRYIELIEACQEHIPFLFEPGLAEQYAKIRKLCKKLAGQLQVVTFRDGLAELQREVTETQSTIRGLFPQDIARLDNFQHELASMLEKQEALVVQAIDKLKEQQNESGINPNSLDALLLSLGDDGELDNPLANPDEASSDLDQEQL